MPPNPAFSRFWACALLCDTNWSIEGLVKIVCFPIGFLSVRLLSMLADLGEEFASSASRRLTPSTTVFCSVMIPSPCAVRYAVADAEPLLEPRDCCRLALDQPGGVPLATRQHDEREDGCQQEHPNRDRTHLHVSPPSKR